jgi:hypothetical protein
MRAHAVENPNTCAEMGPWFDEMLRLVPVSIVMAGAALEANVNEILQNIIDEHQQFSVTKSRLILLNELKEERSGNAPLKYRRLALLLDKEPVEGVEAWENAKLLVKLRNDFMHFRPSWDDDDIHNGKLVDAMKKKVRIAEAYKQNFLFPYGLITYDCAKWAVQTVLALSADFSNLTGVPDRFKLPGLDFTLP